MAIHVQRHANISKQATLLDGLDVSPLKWRVCGCGLNRFVHEDIYEPHLKCRGSFKELQWKCKYFGITTSLLESKNRIIWHLNFDKMSKFEAIAIFNKPA